VERAAPILQSWEGKHIKDIIGWVRDHPGRYHIRLVGPDPYQSLTPGQAVFARGARPSAPGTPAGLRRLTRPAAERTATPHPTREPPHV
jgi:hypothetical protein